MFVVDSLISVELANNKKELMNHLQSWQKIMLELNLKALVLTVIYLLCIYVITKKVIY